jgi:hypothetical protein
VLNQRARREVHVTQVETRVERLAPDAGAGVSGQGFDVVRSAQLASVVHIRFQRTPPIDEEDLVPTHYLKQLLRRQRSHQEELAGVHPVHRAA